MRHWLAQRVGTREWLSKDLPIDGAPEPELSGPGALALTITPEIAGLVTSDGSPMFDPWGTLIYLEESGQIRWAGIVVDVFWDGPDMKVECAGFSTYPYKQPYRSEYVGIQVDPTEIVRVIWAHLQGYPDGDLGVTVGGSTSSRLGTDSDIRRDAAKVVEDQAKKALDAARKAVEAARKAKRPKSEIDALTRARDAAQAVFDKRKDERTKLDELVREDGGSYRLNWLDNPDCGREIDALAREADFEWIEVHQWNADKTDVLHKIVIADRIGARRNDLSFEQGVNVMNVVSFDEDGDEYASEIFGIGAGEGDKALHTAAGVVRKRRLRRARVMLAKDVTSKNRLMALARAELAASGPGLQTTTITVIDHPHAPLGSWSLGDHIRVTADAAWLGHVSTWQRIVAWRMVSDTAAVLTLAPSRA